jgi:hypothetical protein
MEEAYHIFQKFTGIEIANDFAKELDRNGIKYLIQENKKSSVGNFEIGTVDFDVAINLRSEDFPKADKILSAYYEKEIEHVDKDYYLFQFTDSELHDIIAHPFEWGHFDYQLAKKLLKDKGETISDDSVVKIKEATIAGLSKTEAASNFKIVAGYILSIIFPFIGIYIGLSIMNNKKILPNGQVFYLHPANDRKRGEQILTISIMWIFILLLIKILFILKGK